MDDTSVLSKFSDKYAENLGLETTSFVWTISTGTLSLSTSNVFFLIIRDVNDEQHQFGSRYLNFSVGVKAPADTEPPVKSNPTTVVVISTVSPSSAPSTTSSSSATPLSSSSSGNSRTVSQTLSETCSLSLSTSTAAPTSTSTLTSTPTALPTPPTAGDLPTGAKLGIIIGVLTAVVLAVLLGWYFGRRRKNNSKKSPFHPFETSPPVPPVQLSELDVPEWNEQKAIPLPFTPRELHAKGKFDRFSGVRELEAWEKPSELHDGRKSVRVYELGTGIRE